MVALRQISKDEYAKWHNGFLIDKGDKIKMTKTDSNSKSVVQESIFDEKTPIYIGTRVAHFFGIPIFPIETLVFLPLTQKEIMKIYSPSKYGVYLPHFLEWIFAIPCILMWGIVYGVILTGVALALFRKP